jgi:hypothetical protein
MASIRDAAEVRRAAQIGAVLPVHPGSGIEQESNGRFAGDALGQRFVAEVLAHFGADRYLVLVDGKQFRMSLPGPQQAGDRLQISLLANTPRPTFLLLPADGADTASLSPAAHLLGKIIQIAASSETRLALVGAHPVVETPKADPSRICAALHDRLAMSGLFHEAHVAEWADGKRSLLSLSQEPQQQLGQPLLRDGESAVGAETISPDLARLVCLQLDALEHRRLLWCGEAWPGQAMQWSVRKETTERPAGQEANEDEERDRVWSTTVHLELPALGTISASLRVHGDRISIRVAAADPSVAVSLKSRDAELRRNLDAAGLRTESLEFCHDVEAR